MAQHQQRDLAGLLLRVYLFSGLNHRQIAKVVRTAKLMNHPPDRPLITEGQASDGFHLIVSGTAVVAVRGRRRRTLAEGDYFGELSMIDGLPRSATVSAQTPLTTLMLSRKDFRALLAEMPELAIKIMTGLSERLRTLDTPGP